MSLPVEIRRDLIVFQCDQNPKRFGELKDHFSISPSSLQNDLKKLKRKNRIEKVLNSEDKAAYSAISDDKYLQERKEIFEDLKNNNLYSKKKGAKTDHKKLTKVLKNHTDKDIVDSDFLSKINTNDSIEADNFTQYTHLLAHIYGKKEKLRDLDVKIKF